MFERITPEAAGLEQKYIDRFMQQMALWEINLHSVLMLRGNDLFYERYIDPYEADTPHRMYSVTKSFVSVAIGFLADEGKLMLDDPIIQYFPDKLPENVSPWLQKQTIRHMLKMSTCFPGGNWFKPEVTDRTKWYFSQKPQKPADSVFYYDSTGSYILGVLVERLSGMKLLDYLKVKLLNRLGGFENAEILSTMDGTPWGDSALLCTPCAMLKFARFVMNYGKWDGEQLLSETYLREATSCQITNNEECVVNYNTHGYGYQIWMTEQNSFAFYGMGGQFAICVPDKDFIFVCTGDNQYQKVFAQPVLFRTVFDELVAHLDGGSLPEGPAFPEKLPGAHGEASSPFAEKINGVTFRCEKNRMGITQFRFTFNGDEGVLEYVNEQGEKKLPFGLKKNLFVKFPQYGYSDDRGNVHEITDFLYDCAASAGWVEEKKLQLRVQIIDRYFGSTIMTFGFVDEKTAGVRMISDAEDFLEEYEGWMIAQA
ncbi:MAG: serine hydrolase [Clostridia bacterium]|nr:serine hydrolase [Clostridia bacterium]